MKSKGRPKKTESDSKSEFLQFRAEAAEKQTFKEAAELAGIDLSTWIRERLRRIARHELEDAGLPIPFLEVRKK